MTEQQLLDWFVKKIQGCPWCIYGASIVATGAYAALYQMFQLKPEFFVVSDMNLNPEQIDGLAVREFRDVFETIRDYQLVIATTEAYHEEIRSMLLQEGFREDQFIFVDNRMENALMGAYYDFLDGFDVWKQKDESVSELNDYAEDILKQFTIYQVKCHVDKPLKNQTDKAPDYLIPIQAGAALTDLRVAAVCDNEGENISAKNKDYCELTATYYAWKNYSAAYKGLCHYRRFFSLTKKDLCSLARNDIDVVLPYPSVHFPTIMEQHRRWFWEEDWDTMLEAMKSVEPEYAEAFSDIYKGQYFYNFNMLIAKKEIFDEYCEFMFRVLKKTEELTIQKGNRHGKRYLAYLGETLTTVYFLKNYNRYRIVHAPKIFVK